MQARSIIFSALVIWGLNSPVLADTLVIEEVQQTAGVARPDRGQSMASVEAQYGLPQNRLPAVGQPPITRWVYPDFTVYFEGTHVIRAVANR